jgi:hypothetical protein
VVTALREVIGACVADYRDRLGNISDVVTRLRALVATYCPPMAVARAAHHSAQLTQLHQHEMAALWTAQMARARQRTCALCDEGFAVETGVVCAAGHALCGACLNRSVLDQTSQENLTWFCQRDAQLVCQFCQPPVVLPRAMQEKAIMLTIGEAQASYLRARVEHGVRQERTLLQIEIEKLRQEMALGGGGDVAGRVRHHTVVVSELLMLRCPSCGRLTEGDWDACFCVTCVGCRGTFCAWCLVTPTDHRHVAHCPRNPRRGQGDMYGTHAEWQQTHRAMHVARVTTYLQEKARNCVYPNSFVMICFGRFVLWVIFFSYVYPNIFFFKKLE